MFRPGFTSLCRRPEPMPDDHKVTVSSGPNSNLRPAPPGPRASSWITRAGPRTATEAQGNFDSASNRSSSEPQNI